MSTSIFASRLRKKGFGETEGDALYLRLDTTNDPLTDDLVGTDYVKTRNGTVTTSSAQITAIAKTGGLTRTITYNGYGYPATIADGTRTWTLSYAADNETLASWAVT